MHPYDYEGLISAWNALAVGKSLRREFRVRAHDGSERWVGGVGVKRPAGRDGRVLAVGLNWEITDRKTNEA
jgi:PAS domain-containing protein